MEDKQSILIVEDSQVNLHILSSALKAEYLLKVARDGGEAIALLAEPGLPDLILLDIVMPDMDGYEVCRRIKSDPRTADIPVIFITSMTKEEDEAQGFDLGAVDYIMKPFSIPVLRKRIRTHLDLNTYRRSLEERNRELASLNLRLRDSNEDLESFAYAVSHDLREPLRVVINYLTLLDKSFALDTDGGAKSYVKYSTEAVQRMDRMITDLLQYSRIQRQGGEFEILDMKDVLRLATMNLGARIEQTAAVVNIGDLPAIRGDKLQIIRVFQNLIGNALKFTAPGITPMITVEGKALEGEVVFSVADNGIGIAENDIPRLFIPFQRLKDAGEYEGTGIGLALCRKILERHGGKIWIESKEGKGSVFRFSIPA
ncbi:MAG: response regulator [Brevinematales bacterium]|nr:response regulator [Brevinematales bacterium]